MELNFLVLVEKLLSVVEDLTQWPTPWMTLIHLLGGSSKVIREKKKKKLCLVDKTTPSTC